MTSVDLNCDLGEGAPNDGALMQLATSVNVACGLHAGDPSTMRATVEAAARRGLAIGAHPGYADREGMGRREVPLPPAQVEALVTYQLGALAAFTRAAGVPLRHVKLHGALYNVAARDAAVAAAAAGAVAAFDPALLFVGLAGTHHQRAAAAAGLRFASEVFADRGYAADGSLVPRDQPGAFVHDVAEGAARVLTMVRQGQVQAVTGALVALRADTVCVHGDNPAALALARAVSDGLRAAGIALRPLDTGS